MLDDAMDLNEILNKEEEDIFMLLENPPKFKVDRNYEKSKEKQCNMTELAVSSEKEIKIKLEQVRKSKLSDSQYKYVYDKEKNIIHDKTCRMVNKIHNDSFEILKDIVHNAKQCKECNQYLLLRKCVSKQREVQLIYKFFERVHAKKSDIIKILDRKNINVKYISKDLIELMVNDDTWRISFKNSYKMELYHNNYAIVEDKRIIEDGFHRQKVNGWPTFKAISDIIVNYKSTYHTNKILEAKEALDKEYEEYLERAPDNEIDIKEDNFNKKTAVRLKRLTLFYDRYLFVDTKSKHYKDVFSKRKIKYKTISEKFCIDFSYGIIVCDIPKWKRRKMFSAINKIKSKMYKEKHRRAYLCGYCLIRHMKKNGIDFTTRI